MFDPLLCMWLIPAFPLAAAACISLLGPRWLRQHSHWPCIAAVVASCVLSFMVLFAVEDGNGEPIGVTWFRLGHVTVHASLRADGLTAIMLVTITFIGSLIAVFASGYMHGDPGYPRFFASVALFIFSMTGLVLANNLFLLYAFWEGVGLCSYLLIGFWFEKPAAAAAARKAFLVTRLGDVGFLLGILLLWLNSGYELDLNIVFQPESLARLQESGSLTWICLLLFCGAIGKSAQFPLHVWLPDAMEGPTPVSALIHAATMVTAGVYLTARCNPLFALSDYARVFVCTIGGITALLAAAVALTQTDLKRVLAYSTVSQLGFMFLALGAGNVTAAIFHLFTHAFFKALLFLAAGSVMHAMGGVIDMRRFGGLRKIMPITHWTFLIGAAALAGVPLLSGFWSKDEILAALDDAGDRGKYSSIYTVLFFVAVVTAALTAFYTTRAYILTFLGEEQIPEEAGHHAHESPPVMAYPLILLAIGAALVGIVVEPFTHWFSHGLEGRTLGLTVHEHAWNFPAMGIGTLAALSGIAVAWYMYMAQPGSSAAVAKKVQSLYQLSLNKFHMDELYEFFIVRPLTGLAEFCRIADLYIVDALIDIIGQVPRLLGVLFRPVQNGLVQFYALAMILGLAVFLVFLATR